MKISSGRFFVLYILPFIKKYYFCNTKGRFKRTAHCAALETEGLKKTAFKSSLFLFSNKKLL